MRMRDKAEQGHWHSLRTALSCLVRPLPRQRTASNSQAGPSRPRTLLTREEIAFLLQ
jgi:hypothetical protein